MKRLILSLLVLVSIQLLNAQTQTNNTTPKDPKAKEILDKLSAKTKSYQSITADFDFQLTNPTEGFNDKQSGSIILKDDKYKVTLGEQEIISNGTLVWTYLKDVDEVQLSEVDEDDDEGMLNPKTIFTLYESGFKYVKDEDRTVNGKTINVIRMYPLNPGEKPFHTVILNIDAAAVQIQSIEIKAKDGNTFLYTIKNFVADKAYKDAQFEFHAPDGVEVIDLR